MKAGEREKNEFAFLTAKTRNYARVLVSTQILLGL
jgi:hypothetical protein